MLRIRSSTGATLSYSVHGSGPPLVLVHGGFSDHVTNWELVKPLFEPRFTVYAVARRGRGETDATDGHSVDDEGIDVATLIESLDEPVFLLGHSYGGQVALAAASRIPHRIRKLVLYEPPWPSALPRDFLSALEDLARQDRWDELAFAFFRDGLSVPVDELDAIRASELWPPIVGDARATLGDLRALIRHDFRPDRFRQLTVPVLLQVGTASPREPFITDAMAAVLPDIRVEELEGQAHEGMTTAPELYASSVTRFLLG
jgi:pimeloyl-ACP methyl ester carboxylesterase